MFRSAEETHVRADSYDSLTQDGEIFVAENVKIAIKNAFQSRRALSADLFAPKIRLAFVS